ncbi:hypothetical protein HZU77_012200 [Neisseriaceae bacterium TC5R-5]|nr:hypothetical protein [Neisseriaceae bacterium TC5R-5]
MPLENTAASPGLAQLFSHPHNQTGIPLSTIREQASQELSSFAQLAGAQLRERDISIPPAISLTGTVSCHLKLENAHPHANKVNAWLQNNDNITRKFKEVEVLYEIIRATESAGEIFPESSCFHIGLTSAGPIAYFEDSK